MKAKELMIGDWVQVPSELNRYKRIRSTFDIDSAVLYEPIPLTTEILEKNGFMWDNLPISQYWEQYGLIIYPAGGGYRMNCGQNVSFKIDYVHELQHTMRLCGIDKEITL